MYCAIRWRSGSRSYFSSAESARTDAWVFQAGMYCQRVGVGLGSLPVTRMRELIMGQWVCSFELRAKLVDSQCQAERRVHFAKRYFISLLLVVDRVSN